jgi:outer membrane protein TolC
VLHLTNAIAQAAVAGAIPAGAAPLTIGPAIDFVIDVSGKRAARTAQAERLADAARWDIAGAEWQVRAQVRDALLQLWAGEQRLALTRQEFDLQQQLLSLLQHRLQAGEAAAPEVARERIQRAQTIVALSNLDRDVAQARARLAAAIGIPVRALLDVDLQAGSFAHPPAIDNTSIDGPWRRAALTERSDVQASLADYAASQAALRLAVAGQYPDLTIGPGYNYDLGVNRYILDLGTTLPVFHQEQGPIAEAGARRREAAAAFTKAQAQVIAAIDQANAAYAASTRGAAASDAVLADEQHRTAQVERAFGAGEADRPTLVSARLVVVAAELIHLDAVVQQRQAVGALEDALQRPLYDPDATLPLPASELPS